MWVISIRNTPPVEGTSATSPSEVENVERSSCANCHNRHIEYKWISCFPYPFLFRVVTKSKKTVQKKEDYLSKNSNLQMYEEKY